MPDRPAIRVSHREVYRGRIFSVSVDRVRMPHGREVDLEVVRHPESVVLLPMPDRAHIVLVRQYRYVIDQWIWELPAGSLDPGEDAEAAAVRECHEEIGLVPGQVERLASFYPTPGYCDEKMNFFRLEALSRSDSPAKQDEDEVLEARVFSVDEARDMLRRGEICDMKSAVGLVLIA